jgi:DNA-binding CsgD family transcriptional regulator
VSSRPEYVQAAGQTLLALLGGDTVGWHLIDVSEWRAELVLYPDEPADCQSLGQQLIATVDDNPMIASYLRSPLDTSPRRLSDVCSRRELLAASAYSEFLRPMAARYQLNILSAWTKPETGCAWTINRSGGDFTEDDLEIAVLLQPLLSALDQTLGLPFPEDNPVTELAEQVHLTRREQEILCYVSTGLTAAAIGHRLRISTGTVRKHLENAYNKLDCHDRLLAVQRARELGLLGITGC